jgi:twitching motility protein PilT
MNTHRCDHIITVEDPLEVIQKSDRCNVTQREVGSHTNTFHAALKGALREDPDIIVIGELRDLETIEMAITASETGHLVIGTLHTSSAANTLNRLLDVFPPTQQPQIRAMTGESLRGVVCQRLIPNIDGELVLVAEILLNNIAVGNIIRSGQTFQLTAVMQTGIKQGMVLMDNAVFNLYEAGTISVDVALENIRDLAISKRVRQMAQGKNADLTQGAPIAADSPEADVGEKKKKGWFR